MNNLWIYGFSHNEQIISDVYYKLVVKSYVMKNGKFTAAVVNSLVS
jgi:hypothetical protein